MGGIRADPAQWGRKGRGDMDTRWLQDFLTLAETGNFTKAAARRNASQAAFSRRIQNLELWAGANLIDRSSFPTRLTPTGEQFRLHAADVLMRLMDARSEMEGRPVFGRDHVRIALPYVISTAGFPDWWRRWTAARPLACSLIHGNVHDLAAALASGAADIMICHEAAEQPVQLGQGFSRLVFGRDVLRPWASRDFLQTHPSAFPGREGRPLPLLSYTAGVYFARLVELSLEAAPQRLIGRRLAESDMADVLRRMAEAGLGVAWLPDSTVRCGPTTLSPLGGPAWEMPLALVAYRAERAKLRAVAELWTRIEAAQ
jgi:LysR family transcriptional regulator, hypochlorite-specific transcription factor HypT